MNEHELYEKMERLGYPDFAVDPGEENVPMVLVENRLICGVTYALVLPDEDLKALIAETLAVGAD